LGNYYIADKIRERALRGTGDRHAGRVELGVQTSVKT